MADLEDLEHLLRDRLEALGPAPRAELLRVLMLPDYERAGRIPCVLPAFPAQKFAPVTQERPAART
jgi:hypothetical protein